LETPISIIEIFSLFNKQKSPDIIWIPELKIPKT